MFDAEAAAFASPQIVFVVTEGQSAALGDSDGNGDIDIYVVQSAKTDEAPDVLLLNAGLVFAAVDVPATTGLGDTVVAIDSDGDGNVEFLVLNGREPAEGPVQLLRLVEGSE